MGACSWVLPGAGWKSWRENFSREGVNLCPQMFFKFSAEGTPSFAGERVLTALGSCFGLTSLVWVLPMSLAWLGGGLIS